MFVQYEISEFYYFPFTWKTLLFIVMRSTTDESFQLLCLKRPVIHLFGGGWVTPSVAVRSHTYSWLWGQESLLLGLRGPYTVPVIKPKSDVWKPSTFLLYCLSSPTIGFWKVVLLGIELQANNFLFHFKSYYFSIFHFINSN